MAKANALGAAKARIVTLEAQLTDERNKSATLERMRELSREASSKFTTDIQVKLQDAHQALEEYRHDNERLQAQLKLSQEALDNSRKIRTALSKKAESARIWAVVLGLALIMAVGSITGGILK